MTGNQLGCWAIGFRGRRMGAAMVTIFQIMPVLALVFMIVLIPVIGDPP